MSNRKLSSVPLLASLTASLMAVMLAGGCVIVVNDDEADAEWVGSYDHDSAVEANQELRDRVGERLAQSAQLRGENIKVSADNGIVTLTGNLGDAALVQQAVEAAAAVDGVRRVVARLTVEVGTG